MLAITNNVIGGVLSLTTTCTFTNKKGIPGLLFTPFIGDNNYIIFTEFKRKKQKSNDEYAHTDHFCTITLTDDLFANKLQIGRINEIIGPVTDMNAKIASLYHYFPKFELKNHSIIPLD